MKEDVSVDIKDNYVLYHMNDEDTEISVIEDFNRVSIVGVLLLFCVSQLLVQFSSVQFDVQIEAERTQLYNADST